MQSALHLRLTSADARIHYDHGIEKIGNQSINFYGSFGFLKTYEKYNYKVGFALLQNGLTADTRLKLNNENVRLYSFRNYLFITEPLEESENLDSELLPLLISVIKL